MNINEVKSLCAGNRLRWTNHVMVRLAQRRISITEVMEALQNGEIIEQYLDDAELWIITAYIPETAKWTDDFKVRKETT